MLIVNLIVDTQLSEPGQEQFLFNSNGPFLTVNNLQENISKPTVKIIFKRTKYFLIHYGRGLIEKWT